jgi:predicted nuclease with TOPRIM domain
MPFLLSKYTQISYLRSQAAYASAASVPKIQDLSTRREDDLRVSLEIAEREKRALQEELRQLRQDLFERDEELQRVSGNAERERRVWDEVCFI